MNTDHPLSGTGDIWELLISECSGCVTFYSGGRSPPALLVEGFPNTLMPLSHIGIPAASFILLPPSGWSVWKGHSLQGASD